MSDRGSVVSKMPERDSNIGDAYARYDSDPRVNGPDDFEAFADAVRPLCDQPPQPSLKDTVSLKSEVLQQVDEAIEYARDHQNLPWKYPMPISGDYVDAILALVRKRLLSRTVIDTAATAIYLNPGSEEEEATAAITAALDAVIGDSDE